VSKKIVSALDWDASQDLDQLELQPLVDALNKLSHFEGRELNAKKMIADAKHLSRKTKQKREDRVDVEALKKWFEKEQLSEDMQNNLLKLIEEAKPQNPHKVKDKLDILDNNTWRTAIVTKVSGYIISITYEGWASQYDENINIMRFADRIKPYQEMTKGRWTGPKQGKVQCYPFDSEAEDFKELEARFADFELKMETFLKEIGETKDAKINIEDVKFLLQGDGAGGLMENMLRARCTDPERDGKIPGQILSRYLTLLTRVLKSGILDDYKEAPKAGRILLDRLLQNLGGDEELSLYYFENYKEYVADADSDLKHLDGQWAKKKIIRDPSLSSESIWE